MTDPKAFSPYNFVRLPKKILINETIPDSQKFSGEFQLELESKTPIFIGGNTINKRPCMQKDFFRGKNGKPVIPGSSMRGMIRTVSEIISFSRLSFVSDKKLITRDIGGTTSGAVAYREKFCPQIEDDDKLLEYPTKKMLGGYLKQENGQFYIQPAIAFNNTTFVHVEKSITNTLGLTKENSRTIYIKRNAIIRKNWPGHGVNRNVTLQLFRIKNRADIALISFARGQTIWSAKFSDETKISTQGDSWLIESGLSENEIEALKNYITPPKPPKEKGSGKNKKRKAPKPRKFEAMIEFAKSGNESRLTKILNKEEVMLTIKISENIN